MSSTWTSVEDIQAAVLALPLSERREIATALLLSLPKDDISELHGRFVQLMKKDFIRLLPAELAFRVLSHLDADDLLTCRQVSRFWGQMCDDQSVWHSLCRNHEPPIVPAHTTWQDISAHRQLLQSSIRLQFSDESFEYDSGEDTGMPSMQSSPSPFTPNQFSGRALHQRPVWERGPGDLPQYQRALAAPQLSLAPPDPANDPPIPSHVQLPTALPKVNYKHLYLVRRILHRRMTDARPQDMDNLRSGSLLWNPRISTLDSQSSTVAGGVPGHVESIYSLAMFQKHMKLPLSTTVEDELVYTMRNWTTTFESPLSTSWPGNAARTPTSSSTPLVSGRDWLLAGSRDRTLRLWQIDCAAPRVVKVFSGGHSGSILCHSVVEIPLEHTQPLPETPSTPTREPAPTHRLVAVSGASDGRICLWDIEHGDGRPEKVIQAHEDSVLLLRGDDEHIVSCSKDRTIRLFDIRTLTELLVIEQPSNGGHRGAINAVALTKEFIISASGDRTLRVWDIRDGRMLATIDAHMRGISCISFESSSKAIGWKPQVPGSVLRGTVVTGSSDTSIKTFYIVQVPPGSKPSEFSFRDMLDLDQDSDAEDDRLVRPQIVIQPGVEFKACVCSSSARVSQSTCTRCGVRDHSDLVRSLSLGEQVVLSASYDSTVKMWNRQTGRLIFDFAGCHNGRIYAVTGDNKRIVSSGMDGRVVVVDFSEGLDSAFV